MLAFLETLSVDRMNLVCWTRNKLLLPAGVIFVGAVLSIIRSQNIEVALIEIIQQIYVLTLFVSLIWIMVRRGHAEQIASAFIISGTFAAIVVLVDYSTGSELGQILSATQGLNLWGRYAGPLRHPNKLGYYLVLTATLALVKWILAEKGRYSLIFGFSFGLQIFAIYLSGSVTAYFGIVLSLFALILTSKQVRKKLSGYSMLLLLLLVVIQLASLNNHPSWMEIFTTGVLQNIERVQNYTADARLVIFQLAFTNIIRNPLIGVGFDQFSTSGLDSMFRYLPGTVHNIFLLMLYCGGLLAFLGLLGVYIYLAVKAFQSLIYKKNKSLLLMGSAASVLSLMLMDQFHDAIYQREKWLAIGLFLGLAWSFSGGNVLAITTSSEAKG